MIKMNMNGIRNAFFPSGSFISTPENTTKKTFSRQEIENTIMQKRSDMDLMMSKRRNGRGTGR